MTRLLAVVVGSIVMSCSAADVTSQRPIGSGSESAPLSAETSEDTGTTAPGMTAKVVRGSLIVVGPAAGSDFAVSQPAKGKITLTPLSSMKINGKAGAATFRGVTRDVRMTLGAGDDNVHFDNGKRLYIAGKLHIDGGKGANMIDQRPLDGSDEAGGKLEIGGDLCVENPRGALTTLVALTRFNIGGDVTIINKSGDGAVQLESWTEGKKNTIHGDLVVTNRGGFHATVLRDIVVRGSVAIAGASELEHVAIASARIDRDLSITGVSGAIVDAHISRNLTVDRAGLAFGGRVKGKTKLTRVNSLALGSATFDGAFAHQGTRHGDFAAIATAVPVTMTRLEFVTKQVAEVIDGIEVVRTVVEIVPVTVTTMAGSGPVTFKSTVAMHFGGGDDSMVVGLTDRVTFKKPKHSVLDGGAGANTYRIDASNVAPAPVLKRFVLETP